MFNETTTELIKCSTDSLMDAVDETAGDDSGLPTAIRNVIGTTHVMEIKTQSYYEYRTHESFTSLRHDSVDAMDDRASSSSRLISADDSEPSFKRPTKKPSVSTPSKPNEDTDLEDSDMDETPFPSVESHENNKKLPVDKKKRKMRIDEDSE
ncbi:hypothetical protein Tco_1091675 [Tanacetum coccineum]|uniref:Uncharacterized protein n=1 Tax=Tanacetum coccineum TaxID=301880 RepID=A0ABQ5IA18_9ASTR